MRSNSNLKKNMNESLFKPLAREPKISQFYSNKKILITGGRGYLGSCLSESLSETNSLLILVDHSVSDWSPSNLRNVQIIRADVRDISSYAGILNDVDIIFHFAALEYRRNGYNLDEDYSINSRAIADIMESCVRQDIRPIIIYPSSANIFGIQETMPIRENSRDNPPSLWSAHKLLAENYISVYAKKYCFKSLILRLPNIFGPSARLSMANRSAVNAMILRAIAKGILNLYDNSGLVRDHMFTVDVTRAFILAGLGANTASIGDMFILGTGVGHTYDSLAEIISQSIKLYTGREIAINRCKGRYGELIDQRNFVGDPALFSSLSGWNPRRDLASDIQQTVRYFLKKGE